MVNLENAYTRVGDTYKLEDGTVIKVLGITIVWPAGVALMALDVDGVVIGYMPPAEVIVRWPGLWWVLGHKMTG